MGSNGGTERAAPARSTRGATRTGIIRHIDDLGRIVIPIEIRKRFALGEKDPLEISVKDDVILLSKPQTVCVFCGKRSALRKHRGRAVCQSCVSELASTAG
ncbi:MAG TPA: AbrB/MazE/SpoVT family DNA-binding domain-containing protein [Gaiellaceae bacterium]|jgi:transcriptional pleiotropic regulator of transition state genes|nr:AbrB/MazE/SpoVT family DNA-binding domain-containing protein [Gaiellaceae bacterium]